MILEFYMGRACLSNGLDARNLATDGDADLLGAELGSQIARDLAGARQVGGIEGDGGDAGMASAAEFFGK